MQQLRQEILNLNNIEKETEALAPTVWTPRPNNVATQWSPITTGEDVENNFLLSRESIFN